MRLSRRPAAITAVLILSSALAGCEAGKGPGPAHEPLYGAASCASFSNVDLRRIKGTREALADARRQAAELRRAVGLSDAAPANSGAARIQLVYRPALRAHQAVAAYRLTDGRWLLRAGADFYGEVRPANERPLSWEEGASLDELVGEACLYDEPAYLPAETPFRAGPDASGCNDGGTTLLEVRSSDGRHVERTARCGLMGFGGEVAGFVLEVAANP